MKKLLFTLLFASLISFANLSQAQTRITAKNPDQFMKYVCGNVSIDMRGLTGLLAALRALLDSLNKFGADLTDISIELNPPNPAQCLDGLDLGGISGSLPSFGLAAGCLNGLIPKVSVELPSFDGLAGCITGLAGDLSVRLPGFDPSVLNSCLSFDFNLSLPSIASDIAAIIRALKALIASLKNLIPRVSATFDAKFMASLNWMISYCLKQYKRNINRRPAARYHAARAALG